MRREPTDAEKRLWSVLKSRQLEAHKFRRQHPIGRYIVDFVCLELMIIIELDGGQHAMQQTYDAARTRALEAVGYRTLRFWNNDVLSNTDGVLTTILDAVLAPMPSPSQR